MERITIYNPWKHSIESYSLIVWQPTQLYPITFYQSGKLSPNINDNSLFPVLQGFQPIYVTLDMPTSPSNPTSHHETHKHTQPSSTLPEPPNFHPPDRTRTHTYNETCKQKTWQKGTVPFPARGYIAGARSFTHVMWYSNCMYNTVRDIALNILVNIGSFAG